MVEEKEIEPYKPFFKWVRESLDELEKKTDTFFSIKFIEPIDIDEFQKRVQEYAEKHPNARIKASAFVFCSEEPGKTKKIEFNSEKNGE